MIDTDGPHAHQRLAVARRGHRRLFEHQFFRTAEPVKQRCFHLIVPSRINSIS